MILLTEMDPAIKQFNVFWILKLMFANSSLDTDITTRLATP